MQDSLNNRPKLETLLSDFLHPNPNINKDAYIDMQEYWPEESIQYLKSNLDSDDVELRRKSVKALSYFGTPIIPTILELYISNSSLRFRVGCLKVLVILAANNNMDNFYKDMQGVIEMAINDDSVELTLAIISLLRQLGQIACPILMRLSVDKNILRAKAAITALGEISDARSEKLLKQLSNNKELDCILRESALEALRHK